MSIFLLILGIFLFICLVIVHEYGHFIAAKRNGVEAEEFGIFFPPRIWGRKMKSGFVFSINILPLGGFVKLKGEHDADTEKGSFGAASLWVKTKIMLAGIFMNVLTAFVIFTFLAVVGLPQIFPNQFTVSKDTRVVSQKVYTQVVEANSPASEVGLKNNDRIISISAVNGQYQAVTAPNTLTEITQSLAGKNVKIVYVNSSGQTITRTTKLRSNNMVTVEQKTSKGVKTVTEDVGYLGVSTYGSGNQFLIQKSTWTAPIIALGLMKQITILTFQGLGHLISGVFHGHPSAATKEVAGPVRVVVLLKNSSMLGYQFVLFIIAVISLSLAIINVLPIPALDGGRLFFTLVPRILRGRPIKRSTEEWINGAGLVFIFMLFILITINDIKNI